MGRTDLGDVFYGLVSVKYKIGAAKFVHTRRALSSTVINSHQEPVSGQACNPLDPH
jgi:hypothetical protein